MIPYSLTPTRGPGLHLASFQPRLWFRYFQAQAESPQLTQAWEHSEHWLPWILPRDSPQSAEPHTKAPHQWECGEQVPGPLPHPAWQAGSLAGTMPSSFPRACWLDIYWEGTLARGGCSAETLQGPIHPLHCGNRGLLPWWSLVYDTILASLFRRLFLAREQARGQATLPSPAEGLLYFPTSVAREIWFILDLIHHPVASFQDRPWV